MVNTAVWATMFATGTLVMQVRYAVKVRKAQDDPPATGVASSFSVWRR